MPPTKNPTLEEYRLLADKKNEQNEHETLIYDDKELLYLETLDRLDEIVKLIPDGDESISPDEAMDIVAGLRGTLLHIDSEGGEQKESFSDNGSDHYPNILLDHKSYVRKRDGSVEFKENAMDELEENRVTKMLEAGLAPGDRYDPTAKLNKKGLLESFGRGELERCINGVEGLAKSAVRRPERRHEIARFIQDVRTSAILNRIALTSLDQPVLMTETSLLPHELVAENKELATSVGYFPDRGIFMHRTYLIKEGKVKMLQSAHPDSSIARANRAYGFDDDGIATSAGIQSYHEIAVLNDRDGDENDRDGNEQDQLDVHQAFLDSYFEGNASLKTEEAMQKLRDEIEPKARKLAQAEIVFAKDILEKTLSLETQHLIEEMMNKKNDQGEHEFDAQKRAMFGKVLENRVLTAVAANEMYQRMVFDLATKSFSSEKDRIRSLIGEKAFSLFEQGNSLATASQAAYMQGFRAGGCAGIDGEVAGKVGGVPRPATDSERAWFGEVVFEGGNCIECKQGPKQVGDAGFCVPCAKNICGDDGESSDSSGSKSNDESMSVYEAFLDEVFGNKPEKQQTVSTREKSV
jgi:hypothetical protein